MVIFLVFSKYKDLESSILANWKRFKDPNCGTVSQLISLRCAIKVCHKIYPSVAEQIEDASVKDE